MIARKLFLPLVALLGLALPSAAHAALEFAPGSSTVTALNANGTIDTQAASHPDSLRVSFSLETGPGGHTLGGEMRDALVELPPGLIGNPQAMPRCSRQQFEGSIP